MSEENVELVAGASTTRSTEGDFDGRSSGSAPGCRVTSATARALGRGRPYRGTRGCGEFVERLLGVLRHELRIEVEELTDAGDDRSSADRQPWHEASASGVDIGFAWSWSARCGTERSSRQRCNASPEEALEAAGLSE